MRDAIKMHKTVYLPVVPKRFEKTLRFGNVALSGQWQINRYGIREFISRRQVRAWQLDAIFMPLVAFDNAGSRLGMGAGYYDVSLSHLRYRRFWRKPLLIGVAFECQKVPHIPAEPWDVGLDAVITEKKIYSYTNAGKHFISQV